MNTKGFFKDLAITPKLIISYMLLGMGATLIISYIFYESTRDALITRTLDQLTSVKILKKGWLESYFEAQQRDIALFTILSSTRSSFQQLDNAFNTFGPGHKQYIRADSSFGTSLRQFKLNHQFINIWLINKEGEVIYTTVKNEFSGRNIFKPGDINPEFILCCRQGFKDITLKDVSYISKIHRQPYIILTAPILNTSGNPLGLLLVEINIDQVNYILTQRTGMGRTGESYVVGSNYLMRSQSRFINENQKDIKVNTIAAREALSGSNSKGLIMDYRNIPVLSSYTPLSVTGIKWALISEMDVAEAMNPVYELRNKILFSLIVLFVLILVITIYLAGKISHPIRRLNKIVQSLSLGIWQEEPVIVDNNDEIGQITQSIIHLTEGLKKTSLFAAEIGKGNFEAEFMPLSGEDILGHSLLEMRTRLIKLSSMVENQNKLKTRALIEGQENERRRISRELHDGVGQMLTALSFKVQELDASSREAVEIKTLLDETIREVRRVSINLMPSVLWDFGLEAALKILIKTIGMPVELNYEKKDGATNLTLEISICLYRIVQESLQNIQKYARQKHVWIDVDHDQNKITMSVKDDGIGFNFENYKKETKISSGLKNIKERALLLNGTVDIISAPGKGTNILVYIPL